MIIYSATNTLNGKMYIGQTKKTLNERIVSHYKNRYKAPAERRTHFQNALIKYPKNVFKWEVISVCETNEQLNTLEASCIKKFDTINNGYNTTPGGTGGDTFTNNPRKEQIRSRMGKHMIGKTPWIKGRHHTPEVKRILAEAGRNRVISEETREKIRASKIGKKLPPEWCESLSRARKGLLAGSRNPKAKRWKLVSPLGVEYHIHGTLQSFCKQHGLGKNNAVRASRHGRKHKGWTITEENL